MTARDLITRALRLIQVVGDGETPSASEASDALTVLNELIDTWATQRLTVRGVTRRLFTLAGGAAGYTVGPGGDLDMPRPTRLEAAGLVSGSGAQAAETELEVYTDEQYRALPFKAQTGARPVGVWLDRTAYPLASLAVFPVLSEAATLAIYSAEALANGLTLNTDLSLAPGYEAALRYELAIACAPEFGVPVPADVRLLALERKKDVERLNAPELLLRCDAGVMSIGGRGCGAFDARSGY